MAFQDQNLTCKDCGASFVWTASEQEFYQQKGFQNAPVRCPTCREKRKDERLATRKWYPITCAQCGKQDQVPFEPRGDRPVLCQDCFKKNKGVGPAVSEPAAPVTVKEEVIPVETAAPQEEAPAAEVPPEAQPEPEAEEGKKEKKEEK